MSDISIKPSGTFIPKDPITERDNRLKKSCEEFESVFTYEMLKSMRKGIEKCDLFSGGQAEEMYQSMLDQELSKSMVGKSSNSISNMLYQQLKKIDEANSIYSHKGLPKKELK